MASPTLLYKTVVLSVFFVCGACSSVLGNVLYTTKARGLHNRVIEFRKPWFQGWAMFVGMSFLIVDTPVWRTCRCPPYNTGGPVRGWGLYRLVAIPALCDLSATVLQSIALLYLIPSVWQMFRGSILLFTALFALCYRHQRLRAVDWAGVIVTIVGITVVGLSAILNGSDDGSSIQNASVGMKTLAMGLIIIAQALQAFQTIVEEQLLHDVDARESEVVAFEGFWGLFLQTFIAMPLANILPEDAGEGIFEHSIESFMMLFSSWKLVGLVIAYSVAIAGLNITGMIFTAISTAIHRNIYEALRSIAVWALSVIIYYCAPNSGAGEKLTLWSLLEGFGFLLSIFGSFIYNRVVKLTCFDYSGDKKAQVTTDESAPDMTSPESRTLEKSLTCS
jgi:hypothetical protein